MADPRKPIGYALLLLPDKNILKSKGLSNFPSQYTNRDHMLARWVSFPINETITTVDDAVDYVQSEAAGNDRCLKCRIGFGNGTQIVFARANPRKPDSLKIVEDYDPQETFVAVTAEKAAVDLVEKKKELVSLVDKHGRGIRPKRPGTLSHYHPDRLFATGPRPHPSQVGFAFTPVSLPSFIVRPNYRIPGCRRGLGDFSENASHYRSRQYCEEDFDNIEEITCRNAVAPARLERAKKYVHSGTFMKTTNKVAGGPLLPHCPLQKQFGHAIGLSKKKQDEVAMMSSLMGRGVGTVGVLNGAGVLAPPVGTRRTMRGSKKLTNEMMNSSGHGNTHQDDHDDHHTQDDHDDHDQKTEEGGEESHGECHKCDDDEEYTTPQHQDY